MVVPVADRHIERGPAEQLLQVFGNAGAVAVGTKEFSQLEIARALAMLLAKQRHRRGVEPPCTIGAVEALHAEGVELIVQTHGLGLRHVDTSVIRQAVHHMLPRANVPSSSRRKLGNPQGAVRLGEVRLGARPAQGGAWRHQHRQPFAQRVQVVNTFATELVGDRFYPEVAQFRFGKEGGVVERQVGVECERPRVCKPGTLVVETNLATRSCRLLAIRQMSTSKGSRAQPGRHSGGQQPAFGGLYLEPLGNYRHRTWSLKKFYDSFRPFQ